MDILGRTLNEHTARAALGLLCVLLQPQGCGVRTPLAELRPFQAGAAHLARGARTSSRRAVRRAGLNLFKVKASKTAVSFTAEVFASVSFQPHSQTRE